MWMAAQKKRRGTDMCSGVRKVWNRRGAGVGARFTSPGGGVQEGGVIYRTRYGSLFRVINMMSNRDP